MIDDLINPKTLRYERKFLISDINRHEIELYVRHHPIIFRERYTQRYINNIYFDTISMSNFFDNVDGASKRIKVRIRWYGNLFGFVKNPVLEFKIKNGYLGSKKSYALNSFYLDKNYSLKVQQELFTKSDLPDGIKEILKPLRYSLLNRYCRKYFESVDHKFRVTIDFDIEFYKLDMFYNYFEKKIVDSENTVMEIKYSEGDDDLAESVTNFFPFRVTKNSKYVSGIYIIDHL